MNVNRKVIGVSIIVVSLVTLVSGVAILWGTPPVKAILVTIGYTVLMGGIGAGICLLTEEKKEGEDET